jgi:hypothetical protein
MFGLWLLLLITSCIADVHPTGKYCGGNFMITITARVKTATIIDLGITILGKTFNCMNEEVILLQNGTISLPNAHLRQNCIYKILDEFGNVDLRFYYDSRRNIVDVQISGMPPLRMERCY